MTEQEKIQAINYLKTGMWTIEDIQFYYGLSREKAISFITEPISIKEDKTLFKTKEDKTVTRKRRTKKVKA